MPFAAALIVALAQNRLADQIYLKQGGCAFTLDVFEPKATNHRAILWMVNGLWMSNHGDINPQLAQYFTDQGFTICEVVTGSQPKYTIPEVVSQVRRAVRFVRASASAYGIDPQHIGIFGGSTGGYLALEVAAQGDDGDPGAKDPIDRVSSRVQAVVAFFPPTDFENWGGTGRSPFDLPTRGFFMPAFGFTDQTPKDRIRQVAHDLSPVDFVKPDFPPTLLVHGAADVVVPPQQSKEMDAVLEKNKVVHKLIVVPKSGHDANTFIKGLPDALAWFKLALQTAR